LITNAQSNILIHVYESRARLETEICKLSHEVRHIAEQALVPAQDGTKRRLAAIEAELQGLWPQEKQQ
jgi:hypothetical protein